MKTKRAIISISDGESDGMYYSITVPITDMDIRSAFARIAGVVIEFQKYGQLQSIYFHESETLDNWPPVDAADATGNGAS
jgi:hypothetical protein